jgi:hypothetical protein
VRSDGEGDFGGINSPRWANSSARTWLGPGYHPSRATVPSSGQPETRGPRAGCPHAGRARRTAWGGTARAIAHLTRPRTS